MPCQDHRKWRRACNPELCTWDSQHQRLRVFCAANSAWLVRAAVRSLAASCTLALRTCASVWPAHKRHGQRHRRHNGLFGLRARTGLLTHSTWHTTHLSLRRRPGSHVDVASDAVIVAPQGGPSSLTKVGQNAASLHSAGPLTTRRLVTGHGVSLRRERERDIMQAFTRRPSHSTGRRAAGVSLGAITCGPSRFPRRADVPLPLRVAAPSLRQNVGGSAGAESCLPDGDTRRMGGCSSGRDWGAPAG